MDQDYETVASDFRATDWYAVSSAADLVAALELGYPIYVAEVEP